LQSSRTLNEPDLLLPAKAGADADFHFHAIATAQLAVSAAS